MAEGPIAKAIRLLSQYERVHGYGTAGDLSRLLASMRCGTCRHWKDWKIEGHPLGYCRNEEALLAGASSATRKDFACLRFWAPKEETPDAE